MPPTRRSLAITALAVMAATALLSADAEKNATVESYQIRNQKFGQLLRPEDAKRADGTSLVLYPAQPWKCMTWKLLPAGDRTFQIQNHLTSKTFAASGQQAQAPVTQLQLGQHGSGQPAWRLTQLPDGLYQITDVRSGQSLTATASENGNLRVVIAPWQAKPEQKWELIKTDPSTLTM